VSWEGVDVVRYPNRLRISLGYLPQEFGIYPHLTAREFLQYLAATKGISGRAARQRIAHLLDLVNLTSAANRLMGTLSGGMKQRVGIAQALLNDPSLLIIDEPTAGLDPEERVRFRNLLAELAGDRLVIMSSHIVSDIASAANKVAVIRMGRLISCATPDTLLAATQGKVWEMTLAASELPEARRRLPISSAVWNSTGVRVRILAEESPGQEARRVEPNLEDAYLYLLSSHQQTRVSA